MDFAEEKAELFVNRLLTDGALQPCDNTVKAFNEQCELPSFYNEDLFKRGQSFYHTNIFSFMAGKLMGLLSVLAIPTILKILMHTKKSSTDMTAYRRYMATLFHMTLWYQSDFKPGSKLWRSILEVRNLHNSASNSGCKAGINRISQKDMALTQFGFMGFQLARERILGVFKPTDEEWQAYIHLWRVIGHLFGIEDRFNICRGNVTETKAICEKLIEKVFLPAVEQKDPDFMNMARHLVDGLWVFIPVSNFNVVFCALKVLLANKFDPKTNNFEEYNRLKFWEKCLFYFIAAVLYSLRWAPSRWYHNHTRTRDFWIIQNFPFLAYYKYGFKNAHVKILEKVD